MPRSAGHPFYEQLNELLIGYFEGLDSERGIAWRAAFNLSLLLCREIGVGTPRGLQGLRKRIFFCFWLVWRVTGRSRAMFYSLAGAFCG